MKARLTSLLRLSHGSIPRGALMTVVCLCAGGSALAGDLFPPEAPAPTMKNLQEIHDQAAQANRAVGGGNALLFFPYVLERPGAAADTQYTFDTTIHLVATKWLVGQGLKAGRPADAPKDADSVTVQLRLYGSNGQPAQSATANPIADPASFVLTPDSPRTAVSLETLIQNAGGFPAPIFLGFVVLSVDSGDWNDVAADAVLIHSHTGPDDLGVTPLQPVRIQAPLPSFGKEATAWSPQTTPPAHTEYE